MARDVAAAMLRKIDSRSSVVEAAEIGFTTCLYSLMICILLLITCLYYMSLPLVDAAKDRLSLFCGGGSRNMFSSTTN
jgi:hypothetical protein